MTTDTLAPKVPRSRTTTLPPIPSDYDRLQPLYEIQTVLAQPIGIEQACEAMLPIVTRLLRVRTVVLLDTTADLHRAFLWAAAGVPTADLEEAREHARKWLGYLADPNLGSANVVTRVAVLVGGVVEEAAQAAINAQALGGPVEIPGELRAAALQRAMAFDTAGTKTA